MMRRSLGFWTGKVTIFDFHVLMILWTTDHTWFCPSRWLVDTRKDREKDRLSQQHATRANTSQQPSKSYSWCTISRGISKEKRIQPLSFALTNFREKKIKSTSSELELECCNRIEIFNWRHFGSMGCGIKDLCERWWHIHTTFRPYQVCVSDSPGEVKSPSSYLPHLKIDIATLNVDVWDIQSHKRRVRSLSGDGNGRDPGMW